MRLYELFEKCIIDESLSSRPNDELSKWLKANYNAWCPKKHSEPMYTVLINRKSYDVDDEKIEYYLYIYKENISLTTFKERRKLWKEDSHVMGVAHFSFNTEQKAKSFAAQMKLTLNDFYVFIYK